MYIPYISIMNITYTENSRCFNIKYLDGKFSLKVLFLLIRQNLFNQKWMFIDNDFNIAYR